MAVIMSYKAKKNQI